MERSDRQRRQVRTEDDRTGSNSSHIPRPVVSHTSSRPPIPMQIAPPPRAHQYRPRPPVSSFRQPIRSNHDRVANENRNHVASSHRPQYANRQNPTNQSQRPYQPVARHVSHVSALSTSDGDSRPVSENYIVSPALPSEAVSEMDENDDYYSTSAPHNHGGSQGRRVKTTAPGRPGKVSAPIRNSETLPSSDQAATMNALTAAIRQGLHTTPSASQSATPKPTPEAQGLRMPFQEPGSPSSVYTDITVTNKRLSIPVSSYQAYDPNNPRGLNIISQEAPDEEESQYGQDIPTPMSNHPIMAGSNPKLAAAGKPLRIDIGAVREAEARGSMTSLSDLIRRATRLASNLDRGKTASRLGYLDMFGSTDKLANMRNSTYSDVLDAFPPPATGTNTPGGRPTTMWPHSEKQHMASKSSLGRFVVNSDQQAKPRRQCCGLSPVAFVLVMIIVFLLVAAAVLVPVFLLILPKQHKSVNLADCRSTHTCQNGGYSVTTDSTCSCVCANGFTGSDCSNERDPECVSATISDGGNTYNNATIGSSVLPLLQSAQNSFNIPLNETILLSQFAYNNLSCVSENSLVQFGKQQTPNQAKRFVIVPGMMSTELHVPVLNLPPSESKNNPRFVIVDGLNDANEAIPLVPTPTLHPRQDATQSANGIVFATSGASSATVTATGTATGSRTASTAASTSSPSSSNTIDATDKQLDFAAVVVLYVLEQSSQISNAVTANQAILTFFQESNPANQTVEVVGGKDSMQANFETFQIEFSNGTVVGGSGST